MKKSKLFKRVCSFVLSAMLCTTFLPDSITVSAATAESNSQAMINFFSGLEGDIQPTDGDLQIFGVFCSNFYTPYLTNQSNITDCIQAGCSALFSGSIPSGKQDVVNELADGVLSNILENSEPLLYNGSQVSLAQIYMIPHGNIPWGSNSGSSATKRTYTTSTSNGGALFGLQSGSERNGNNYVYTVSGTSGDSDFGAELSSLAVTFSLMSALSSDADGASDVIVDSLSSLLDSNSSDDDNSPLLYVTPFGDIIARDRSVIADFYVVVPGCLNPYTFTTDGSKLPTANRFYMSSLATGASSSSDGDINASLQMSNKAKNNTLIYGVGLSSATGITSASNVDATGYYFKFNQKALTTLATAIATYRHNAGGSGQGEGVNMLEEMSELLANRYIYASTSNISSVMQGMLLFDFDGTYETVEELRSLGLDYFYADLNSASVATEGQTNEFDSESGYDDDDNADTSASTGDSSVGTALVIKDKSKGAIKAKSTSYDSNTLTYRNFESKIGSYKYFYMLQLPSQLYSVTYSASDAASFQFYPQVYYTYMLNTYDNSTTGLNPNLPTCDASLVSDLASLISSGVGVDTDAQELATSLMKRMKALTDEGISDDKSAFLDDYINSFVLTSHRKMLGISDNNITSVSTNNMLYAGFTGHVTTPTLNDISFTQTLVDNYRTIYVVLLSIVVLFLAIMFITKTKTWKQCISLALVMAVCLTLPEGVINGVVTLANSITSNLYNNRFNYWAIIQHQQYLEDEFEADKTGNTITSLLADNVANNTAYYSEDGIKLRWMAPRKEDVFDSIFGNSLADSETANGLVNGAAVFKMLFSGYFKGESYSTDAMATYVYRTYKSVADEAKELAISLNSASSVNAASEGSSLLASLGVDGKNELDSLVYGLTDKVDSSVEITYNNESFRTAHLGDSTVSDALTRTDVTWEATATKKIGFEVGSDPDTNLNAYILYSESPFYYFYNALLQAKVDGSSAGFTTQDDDTYVDNFLPVLLSTDLYKVTDTDSPAYGMTKDFLDLEGLFTYVVPYMYQGNSICNSFVELRGTDYRTWETSSDDTTVLNTKEDVQYMWNMYCPWVDTLYSTSILNDSVSILGTKYTIADAFNPSFYHNSDETKGRNMVFGEAEAYMAGVSADQMTDVETKINNVLENTYEDLRYLANYSAFSDDVLITAAAMMATFEFNKEFSEVKLFGDSHVLYPQGYELKTFSYDAFLRLILLNSTGQSVMASGDIYTTVIENTSFLTGLCLLALDFVAVYVVPSAKLVFLVGVFILSLLMLLTCFLQGIENAPKTVINVVIMPMLKFLLVTIVHATATAMLMGEGLTDLVGSQYGSIVTNDPTVTIILLMLINTVAAVFYVMFIVGIIKEGISWLKSTISAATGLVKGLVSTVSGKLTNIAATGEISGGGLSINKSGDLATAAAGAGAGAAVATAASKVKSKLKGANLNGGEGQDSGDEMSRQYNNTMNKVLDKIKGSKNNKSEMTDEEKAKEQERIEHAKQERAEKSANNKKKSASLSSKAAQAVKQSALVQNTKNVGKNVKTVAKATGAAVIAKTGAVASTVAASNFGRKVTNVVTPVSRAGKAVAGGISTVGRGAKKVVNGAYISKLSDKAAAAATNKLDKAKENAQFDNAIARRRKRIAHGTDVLRKKSSDLSGDEHLQAVDAQKSNLKDNMDELHSVTDTHIAAAKIKMRDAALAQKMAQKNVDEIKKQIAEGKSVDKGAMKRAKSELKEAKSKYNPALKDYKKYMKMEQSINKLSDNIDINVAYAQNQEYREVRKQTCKLNKKVDRYGRRGQLDKRNAVMKERRELWEGYANVIKQNQDTLKDLKAQKDGIAKNCEVAAKNLEYAKKNSSEADIVRAKFDYQQAKNTERTYKATVKALGGKE